MANLIITVISIALVAVAALMGAYYGGQAYMEGQAKAKANAIAQSFDQVGTALNLYNTDNGIIYQGAGGSYQTQLGPVLLPKYLTKIPNPGDPTISSYVGEIVLYKHTTMTNGLLNVYLSDSDVCRYIEGMRTGTVPTINRNQGGAFASYFIGKIGCVYDINNNWFNPEKRYIAYYNIYGSMN